MAEVSLQYDGTWQELCTGDGLCNLQNRSFHRASFTILQTAPTDEIGIRLDPFEKASLTLATGDSLYIRAAEFSSGSFAVIVGDVAAPVAT